MRDRRRGSWWPLALLAVLFALIGGACAGDSDTKSDEASTTAAEPKQDDTPGADFSLPPRMGEKPTVTDGIPHVQLDENSPDDVFEMLTEWAFSLEAVVERPSRVSLPGARALTLSFEFTARPTAMIFGREFAHIHPQPEGGSLHIRLRADQATEVVDRGWGEWHPFALDGTLPNLVMVYAPRTDEDLEVVQKIIENAVAYASSGSPPE